MNTDFTAVNVYLIDDNEIMNFINQRLMTECGSEIVVKTFLNGLEAIMQLNNKQEIPDFLFVDIEMPVMNGWEFLDMYTAKYAELCPDTQVYIVSSSVSPIDKAKAAKYPFVRDYLVKPIEGRIFCEILARKSNTACG